MFSSTGIKVSIVDEVRSVNILIRYEFNEGFLLAFM